MHASRALLLTIFACATVLAAACGGSKSCAQGTEQCPCYGNGTCNPGLTCASNTCVNLGGAGGASGGGGTGTGRGGSSAAGTGGTATAGAGGTGVGGGTGGSCTANTSTDPQNCGACGHVCKNADPIFMGYCPPNGCCVGGRCAPSFSAGCFVEGEITNCAEYCASIGETCVDRGCALDGTTWAGWDSRNACTIFYLPPPALQRRTCGEAIAFDATTASVRCCCTDTH